MGCGASAPKNVKASDPVVASATLSSVPSHLATVINDTKQAFHANYEVVEVLYRSPGLICKKCKLKATGVCYTAKVISKKAHRGFTILPTHIRRELLTLKTLDHPNLVKIVDFYETGKSYIVLQEICAGGSLYDRVLQLRVYSEVQVLGLMRQLLSVVSYCHAQKVMHRDLSPERIFLEFRDDSDPVLKVIDFGNMAFFDVRKILSGKFGSVYYCAPEVFSEDYNEMCDLWSCGVIMHVLLTGTPPFQGVSDEEIKTSILEDIVPLHNQVYSIFSHAAKDLLHRLLIKSPAHRITAGDALRHQWFLQTESASVESLERIFPVLDKFQKMCRLKDALFGFICNKMLVAEEMKEMKEVFESMDSARKGKLRKEEVIQMLEHHVPFTLPHSYLESICTQVDIDHNGLIEHSEFLKALENIEKVESKEVLRKTFEALGPDASGFVSAAELKALADSGDMSWDELLNEADTNGDGVLELREFEALLQRKWSNSG